MVICIVPLYVKSQGNRPRFIESGVWVVGKSIIYRCLSNIDVDYD